MKFLRMTINAIFDDSGEVKLYVHKNNKFENGLPIKDYHYRFTDENEAVKNIDLLIHDKDYLMGIVKESQLLDSDLKRWSFPDGLNNSREYKVLLRKHKRRFKKNKAKEKVYYLTVDVICEDNIKVNLVLTGTIL